MMPELEKQKVPTIEVEVLGNAHERGKVKRVASLCEHSIRGGHASFRIVPAGQAPPDDSCGTG